MWTATTPAIPNAAATRPSGPPCLAPSDAGDRSAPLGALLFRTLLLCQAASPPGQAQAPAAPFGPVVTLAPADLSNDPVTRRLVLASSYMPPPATGLPFIDPQDPSPAAQRLRQLVATGRVAGLSGVLHDNRDRGHLRLPPGMFPDLTRVAYSPVLRGSCLDFGLAGAFRIPAITFGNSSTANTSEPAARSLVGLRCRPGRPGTITLPMRSTYIPKDRDHDAVDVYPAAWP